MSHRPITFLTDYGLDDPFVGVCHAVMARIAPGVQIIDLTHGIPRQDVRAGAVALVDAIPYLPAGVVVAVVDPGVGGDRRAVAISAGGQVLIGPDNGVLIPAVQALGGPLGVWEIRERRFGLEPVSRTFHGRDVFAPAAAHVAAGAAPDRLGPSLDAGDLVVLSLPPARVDAGRIDAEVRAVDGFGNVQLNVTASDLHAAGLEGVVLVEVAGGSRQRAVVVTTFGDLPDGRLGLLEDSSWRVALTVNRGSAAEVVGLLPGARLRLLDPATRGGGG